MNKLAKIGLIWYFKLFKTISLETAIHKYLIYTYPFFTQEN